MSITSRDEEVTVIIFLSQSITKIFLKKKIIPLGIGYLYLFFSVEWIVNY